MVFRQSREQNSPPAWDTPRLEPAQKIRTSTRSPSSALFPPCFGEASPTNIDFRKKLGTLILTFLLEDLVPGFDYDSEFGEGC